MTLQQNHSSDQVSGQGRDPAEVAKFREGTHGSLEVQTKKFDTFVLDAAETIVACERHVSSRDLAVEINDLFEMVHKWCAKHDIIDRCVVNYSPTGIFLNLILKGDEPDFEFPDAISEFAIELHARYPKVPVTFRTAMLVSCRQSDLQPNPGIVIYEAAA